VLCGVFCGGPFASQPVYKLTNDVRNAFVDGRPNREALRKVWNRLERLGCPASKQLMRQDAVLTEKAVTKAAMRAFCPVADAVLYMIAYSIPNPMEAQALHGSSLYTGPSDDRSAAAMRACDADGPLVVYISKMVPLGRKAKGFIACGRVFSGTVRPGQSVLVLPPADVEDKREEATSAGPDADGGDESKTPVGPPATQRMYKANVQRVVALLGAKHVAVDAVPAGNVVGLVGVEQHLLKSGTVTDSRETWPLRAMKFSVSPVVRVAIRPPKPHQSAALLQAVRAYSKTDPCVQHYIDGETRQLVLAGAGELHLEVAVTSIATLAGFEPTTSEPVVSYRETVTMPQGPVQLAKSANKLNRLFVRAGHLDDRLVSLLEDRSVDVDNAATTARFLSKEYVCVCACVCMDGQCVVRLSD